MKEEKNYTVYAHINKVNGKVYIGITKTKPEKRWGRYGRRYKNNILFWNAINKYTWDEFEHKILHKHIDKETACILERMYISFYKKRDISYNIAEGGEGTRSFSEETRRKISEANTGHFSGSQNPMFGKHHSDETKRKISEANTGRLIGEKNPNYMKSLSDETRNKISNAHKGKMMGEDNPMYGRKGKYSPLYGRKHSDEAKQKMSDAQKGSKNHMFGKHHTEESKKKISEKLSGENSPWFGKHHTEESKKKISESHKEQKLSGETKQKMSNAQKGSKNHNYGKGFQIKIDNDPNIYTVQEASILYKIDRSNIVRKMKKYDKAEIKSRSTNQIHIIYKVIK